MKLRERWRQAKEHRRKINEAIDKQLTPEQKVAILENSHPLPFLPFVFILLIFSVLLVIALAMADVGYGLKYYFGENAWENMVEAGKVEFGSSSSSPTPIIYPIMGLAIFILVVDLYSASKTDKKIVRLKREILARLDAEGIKK